MMPKQRSSYEHLFFSTLLNNQSQPSDPPFIGGGLFLDHQSICPPSFVSFICSEKSSSCSGTRGSRPFTSLGMDSRSIRKRRNNMFMSVSLSLKEGNVSEEGGYVENGNLKVVNYAVVETAEEEEMEKEKKKEESGSNAAFNTTKHLWAGAVAAMVSRCF